MQTVIYVGCGLFFYFAAFLVVGGIGSLIFGNWAIKKVGTFFEYSIAQGMQLYYPDMYYNLTKGGWLYKAAFIVLWPVMLTRYFVVSAKSLVRLSKRYNW